MDENDWDLDARADRDARKRDDAIRYIAQQSETWRKEHAAKSVLAEKEIANDHPNPSAEERLLLRIAAHDAALVELLGDSEVQLAKRVQHLVDNPDLTLKLARALQQVVTCRSAAALRMRDVLQMVGVLRGQRRLRETSHLRRVA